jgi:hypothetical protein
MATYMRLSKKLRIKLSDKENLGLVAFLKFQNGGFTNSFNTDKKVVLVEKEVILSAHVKKEYNLEWSKFHSQFQ